MRTPTHGRSGVSWLVLLGLAACTGGQTGDEGPSGRPDAGGPPNADFFDVIRTTFGNYDAARSVGELAERSERIAVGTLAAVREGRPLSTARDEEVTAVLELGVSEVLKGEPSERFYIELYVGLVFDGPIVPDPLPEDRLLVFLIPAADTLTSAPDASVTASIPGLPEGERLYTPTTPQGLMVEDESGDLDAVDLVVPGSFDEVVDSLRSELR